MLVSACGGGGGGGASNGDTTPPATATTYTVSTTVAGLSAGSSLALSNGAETISVANSGSYAFTSHVTAGASYDVTVSAQPAGKFCNVARGHGTASANITDIQVTCAVRLAGGAGALSATGGTFSTPAVDVLAPANASLATQNVTVQTIAPPAGLPTAMVPVGAAVDVAIDKPALLNAPYTLTLRYDASVAGNEDQLTAMHYDNSASRWEPVTVLSQDKVAHSITFESRTFSPFAIVSFANAVVPASFSVAGFTAQANGWNIENDGNRYYTPGGNCLGMSGYALWYHSNRSDHLNGKFSSAGAPSMAELVATRAQLAQSQYWAGKSASALNTLGDAATARLMRAYLALTNQPLILLLRGPSGGHASVLYGYDANGFKFYDVNHLNAEQTLGFDGSHFSAYEGYTSFAFVALPSLGRTEDFAALTAEAEGGFTSSSAIQLRSPTANQQIAGHSATLSGSLTGSLNSNISMIAYIKGVPQLVAASAGAFNATIPITHGDNTVVLLAGVQIGLQSNWNLNGATLIVHVNGSAPLTTLLTTLTWDQNGTDVDLYVKEPGVAGPSSWFGGKTTANGLTLDFDNTSGYGPEHATLTTLTATSGTVVSGLYTVQVHYYSSHNTSLPATGTVTIVVNEGQPSQKVVSRPFSIATSNSSNAAPGGIGADWVTIGTVDLVNGVITSGP
jgi:uncharacterized protein YfaP (DUF2135 family)